MPVTIAPINGQVEFGLFELGFQGANKIPGVAVDRTDASKVLVARGDFLFGSVRHAKASENVLEKWHDVVRAFRAAERYDQQRIEVLIVAFEQWIVIQRKSFPILVA